MKLADLISLHPWIFAGLSVLPCSFVVALFVYLYVSRLAMYPDGWPHWVFYAALSSIPLLVFVVGFLLAYCFSLLLEGQLWLIASHWANAYLSLFIVSWNVVFLPLSLLNFVMGFSAFPAPTSIANFSKILVQIYCVSFSTVILVSLIVCSIAAAIMVLIWAAIIFGLYKIRNA